MHPLQVAMPPHGLIFGGNEAYGLQDAFVSGGWTLIRTVSDNGPDNGLRQRSQATVSDNGLRQRTQTTALGPWPMALFFLERTPHWMDLGSPGIEGQRAWGRRCQWSLHRQRAKLEVR